jgi:uncharacterized membrane protein
MSRNKKKSKPSKSAENQMNASQKSISQDKQAAKKAAVLGTDKKNRLPLFAVFAGMLLLAAGGFFFIQNKNKGQVISYGQSNPTNSTTTQITYPANLFEDGNARHFAYRAENITVKYFILKSSDGVIRAAFDACDVCWKAGKGYFQAGDNMICKNCGRKFASVLVNEVKGGCNPAPLNRSVENGNVIIRTDDILDGKPFFNFSGGV